MVNISNFERKAVFEILKQWSNIKGGFCDHMWYGYSQLEDEIAVQFNINIPENKLKKIMKEFRDKNIAEHIPCVNSDGMPYGSGNFLIFAYQDCEWIKIEDIIN